MIGQHNKTRPFNVKLCRSVATVEVMSPFFDVTGVAGYRLEGDRQRARWASDRRVGVLVRLNRGVAGRRWAR